MGKSNRAQVDVVEDLSISSEVFDFTHILSSTSEGSQKSKAVTVDHEKDLNISNVLATIRDEGPAVLQQKKSAPDVFPKVKENLSDEITDAPVECTLELAEAPINTDKPQTEKVPVIPAQITTPSVPLMYKMFLVIAVLAAAYMVYEFTTEMDALQKENQVQLQALLQRIGTLETAIDESSYRSNDGLLGKLQERQQTLETKLDNDLQETKKHQALWSGKLRQEVEELKLLVQKLNQRPEREQIQVKPIKKKVQKPSVTAGKGKAWAVNLLTLTSKKEMLKIQKQFIKQGVDAEVVLIRSKGRQLYRLSKNGFSSKNSAIEYRNKVAKKLNLDGVWVSKLDS